MASDVRSERGAVEAYEGTIVAILPAAGKRSESSGVHPVPLRGMSGPLRAACADELPAVLLFCRGDTLLESVDCQPGGADGGSGRAGGGQPRHGVGSGDSTGEYKY